MKNSNQPVIFHGGDYNPDQWLGYPEILAGDFVLMKSAHINTVTVGVFAWAALEPEEGRFEFGWLDDVFDRAEKNNFRVILATPSGGKPNWLALKYPEVRRVGTDGLRDPQERRHNHCLTSPVYRSKVREINTRLAERYGKRPSLTLWHVSNEYLGYCYCDLCFAAFQSWLQERYQTLENLNDAYWSRFWSHTFTAWDQIRTIDDSVNALSLDWKRFMTGQCADFLRAEAVPLREHAPGIPITTNFHPIDDYDYFRLAEEIDVVSWDSYPDWHTNPDGMDESAIALETAFRLDICRGMKSGKPFLLMECTPAQLNWRGVSPLRRPGMLRLSSLQAVAHGSDAVCYFQIRKGRGGSEKFHGAVIDHAGHADTRVFREVAALGETLEKLSGVIGARVPAKVALVFDWENLWAFRGAGMPQNSHKEYIETCLSHYRPFWKRGIAVDIMNARADFSGYDLVLLPMLYLVPDGMPERISAFVKNGGTLVATYQTGYVNETDLCFMGGAPGPLSPVLGIRVEEFDALPDSVRRSVIPRPAAGHGLSGVYEARHFLDIVHCEGAEPLAEYGSDFYAGSPAVTVNAFGDGRAYYIASRNDDRFQDDFFGHLAESIALPRTLPGPLPPGVTAHLRENGSERFVFLLNFTHLDAAVSLPPGTWRDVDTGGPAMPDVRLGPLGSKVFQCES